MTAVDALTELIEDLKRRHASVQDASGSNMPNPNLMGKSAAFDISLDLAKSLLVRAKAEDAANIGMHQIAEDRWTFFEHRPSCNCVPCMRHVERSVGGGGV
jgi:hypothetical protein